MSLIGFLDASMRRMLEANRSRYFAAHRRSFLAQVNGKAIAARRATAGSGATMAERSSLNVRSRGTVRPSRRPGSSHRRSVFTRADRAQTKLGNSRAPELPLGLQAM